MSARVGGLGVIHMRTALFAFPVLFARPPSPPQLVDNSFPPRSHLSNLPIPFECITVSLFLQPHPILVFVVSVSSPHKSDCTLTQSHTVRHDGGSYPPTPLNYYINLSMSAGCVCCDCWLEWPASKWILYPPYHCLYLPPYRMCVNTHTHTHTHTHTGEPSLHPPYEFPLSCIYNNYPVLFKAALLCTNLAGNRRPSLNA